MEEKVTLKRGISLGMMTLYGLGTTIGAGIYALLGAVAGAAGVYAPFSFLLASALAGFSAFTFAELSARFPQSAGEAVYVREGVGLRALAVVVGLMVLTAGAVSSATIANGFVGYFQQFVDLPSTLAILGFVALLAVIAAWGISESVVVACVLTIVEAGGLLMVIWAGRHGFEELPTRWAEFLPPPSIGVWSGIFAGSFLAFYAFIGFEDMVNVAEEVTDVTRTLPRAIILTLVITTVLYMILSVVAVLNLPVDELAASGAPLALLYQRATGGSAMAISVIGTVAMVNGALIQVIMGARILYGLSSQGHLPALLSRVNPVTRTPVVATVVMAAAIGVLATLFELVALAQLTSLITLTVFALVNLALWRIKRRAPTPIPGPAGLKPIAMWVPITGFAVSLGFVVAEISRMISQW